jgi:hypothetical protein
MKMKFASLPALALVAFAALLLMLAPVAFACPTPTVQAASTCNASQQAGTSGTTICYSGTNSSNYVPFSLTAVLNGTQTLPVSVNGQVPTYLIKNDTSNTTLTLTFTGSGVGGSWTGNMLCSNTLANGLCQITGPAGTAGEGANYGPPSGGWPSSIVAQFTFNNVPTGSNFDLNLANFASDGWTGSFSGACYGSCQVANSCTGGGTTTVTGRVYVPNGADPLPNALVYIPSSVPDAIPAGVECLTNGNEASGNPVTFTYSKYDGTFTLTGVPSGTNIPIVVQSGKWRMQGTISTVTACGSTVAPTWATTMPSTHVQGDIPKIAMVTGSVDAVECVLLRTGLNQSEFTDAGGTGQVNLFKADSSGGVTLDSGTTLESTLTGNLTLLNSYDMLMLACQGNPDDPNAKVADDLANVLDWANRGGRVFATHYEYAWLYNSLNAASVTQTINGTTSTISLLTDQGPKTAIAWNVGQADPAPDPGNAVVNTSFTDGVTFSNWLENPVSNAGPAASTTAEGSPAQISLNTLRLDQNGPGAGTPTQVWMSLTANTTDVSTETATPAMQLVFNTPVGAGASNQCGKVLYNDYHVYNGTYGGETFPNECPSGAMTPQEHALEYALFDLTNAVTPVTAGNDVEQTFVNSPSPAFTQGDTADQITINVENDGSESLSSSLTLAGVLPTGITVNTSSFTSNGWTCTTSAGGTDFNCTRTTPLPVGATEAIVVPVQVASNAPTSPVGDLTDTISGGGLSSNVTGTDALPILGKPVISWATPASIVYGTSLSNQLDASATCGGSTVPGTYAYTYNGNAITEGSGGSVLPAGNDILTVTFTPSTITASCPVQTTTVTQVVTPAPLVVTAINQTKTYDTPNPTLTDSITGFVNGDTIGSFTGSATLTTTAVTSSPVGSYPITFATETLANPNYTVTYVPATLTVTQGAGAITWSNPASINYGTPLSATQLNAIATCGGVQVPGNYVYTPALGTVLNAGSYTLSVTFTPTDSTDCPVESTTVPLTVNKAVITVTAANQSMNYGAPVPTLTDSYSGFVNGDNASVIGGTATLTTTATSTSPVVAGGYPITFSSENLTAANYTFIYVPGTLTINSIAGAINWPTPAGITYGTGLTTQLDATATCGGASINGTYTYTYGGSPIQAGTVLPAGADVLSVTFVPSSASSCTFASTNVTINVAKAVLLVTANNASKTYGQPNPGFSDTITGFVNGDTSSVVSGSASLTTTATTTSPVGTYPITAALGSLSASNYTFTFAPGTLTISQVTGTITWATPSAITYGTPLSSVQLDAVATYNGVQVPGVYTYTPASGTILPVGTQLLKVTFTPTDSTDYPVESTTVNIVVAKPPADDAITIAFSNTNWNYPGEANVTICVAPATNVAATGTVVLYDGNKPLVTLQLQGNGCAYWYITPGLNVGTHNFTAVYSGDSNNPAGQSIVYTIVVTGGQMTMEASCWNASFPYGANYQCNANTDSGPKSGYMTYVYDGGTPVKLPLNSNGATAWSISKPPVGTHTILIAYPPQGNWTGATLPLQTFVVTGATDNVTLVPSTWNPNTATSLTFKSSVTSVSAGAPNGIGSVSYYDGGVLIGTENVDSNGNCSFTTTLTKVGNHTITATYTGANYSTTSVTINIVVIAAPSVATPKFSLAGGTFTTVETITLSDSTKGAVIYYTTDGSTPTTSSAVYSGAITVSGPTETIEAFAVAPGYSNSSVAIAKFIIQLTAATPKFSVAAGTYSSVQTVSISDTTAGVTIYFTTDGSTPTIGSTVYSVPITVSVTETIKAIAVVSGYSNSPVASAKYTIVLTVADTPDFSLPAGTYTGAQTMKMTDLTAGATIYYTTDGSTPTTSSTKVTGSITIASSETVKAIAVAPGYANSPIAVAKYTIK